MKIAVELLAPALQCGKLKVLLSSKASVITYW